MLRAGRQRVPLLRHRVTLPPAEATCGSRSSRRSPPARPLPQTGYATRAGQPELGQGGQRGVLADPGQVRQLHRVRRRRTDPARSTANPLSAGPYASSQKGAHVGAENITAVVADLGGQPRHQARSRARRSAPRIGKGARAWPTCSGFVMVPKFALRNCNEPQARPVAVSGTSSPTEMGGRCRGPEGADVPPQPVSLHGN